MATPFKYRQGLVSVLMIMAVGVIGATVLVETRAATPPALVEAENGTRSTNAQQVSDTSASGGGAVMFKSATTPPSGDKPTDATTGPRIATTNMSGGDLTGTYSGKHFTTDVTAHGPLTLTDCIIDGGIQIYDGPVVIDHCTINGWFGVTTDNTNPNKSILKMTFSKVNGPTDDDTMRIGTNTAGWGNNSVYVNTLIEDSIIHAQFNDFGRGAHFDILQFGGGQNSTFNRVVFTYDNYPYHEENTNYVNNGTDNVNVVFNQLWAEGGPVGYVLAGPMTVNTCTLDQSAAYYDFVYPVAGTVLHNCFDDTGAPITSD